MSQFGATPNVSKILQILSGNNAGCLCLSNAGDIGIAEEITDKAFRLMLTAKYGTVPQDKSIKLTDKPVIELDDRSLEHLEGTYKSSGSVVTFKVENKKLHYIQGNRNLELAAHSPTEFTADGDKYTFYLDESGKPKFVHKLGKNSVDTLLPNDRPGETPGPNRPEWSKYIGKYQGPAFGIKYTTRIFLKNGYLYSSRGDGTKLTEYQPELFFTADGEAVIFQNGRMSLGNRPVVKVSDIP